MARAIVNGYNLKPAPGYRSKVTGSKLARETYDAAHLAWRAGLISDFYYGRRSPVDATIVWRLNGHELELPEMAAALERRRADMGIMSIAWGEWWVGYRSVTVTYRDGSSVTERYDAAAGTVAYDKAQAS